MYNTIKTKLYFKIQLTETIPIRQGRGGEAIELETSFNTGNKSTTKRTTIWLQKKSLGLDELQHTQWTYPTQKSWLKDMKVNQQDQAKAHWPN